MQMEFHQLINRKDVNRKLLLLQPNSLKVEITFLFDLFSTRINHYVTSVNPVWSTVVMVEPTIELCGKYLFENLFIWTQLSYTLFSHLDGLFASLWEFPIHIVWPYRQSCKGLNIHICQQFHRTPCYFWCGHQWLSKKLAH